eukprot:SAG11_NODE_28047_length_326_cov_0.559471_1_plen_79_part_10
MPCAAVSSESPDFCVQLRRARLLIGTRTLVPTVEHLSQQQNTCPNSCAEKCDITFNIAVIRCRQFDQSRPDLCGPEPDE